MSTINLRLPGALHARARKLAKSDIATAVAETTSAMPARCWRSNTRPSGRRADRARLDAALATEA